MLLRNRLAFCSLLLGVGLLAPAATSQDATAPEETQIPWAQWHRVRVFPFNDLGMHCVDKEYSVYSILPPYNVLRAQAVYRNPNGDPILLDDTHISLQYKAQADINQSKNSTSIGKTDFWQWSSALFGVTLAPGEGLKGYYMPADAPDPSGLTLEFDATHEWFSAEGVPIMPIDDRGNYNAYPIVRVQALRNSNGKVVGETDVVLPVSSETDCANCHATGQMAATNPAINWSNLPDLEKQTKTNVLLLHDWEEGTDLQNSTPVLCAECHYSPALDLDALGPIGNQIGNPLMSETMHLYHGNLTDSNGTSIFPSTGTMVETCYQCHPGKTTECLRGPMAAAGMNCNSCHGDMLSVGGAHPLLPGGSIDGQNDGNPRRPWLDLPRCQSCHTGDENNFLSGSQYVMAADGLRLQQAWVKGDLSASPIPAPNSRFAEDTDSLYRLSDGHNGMACEACHGPTHAIWSNPDTYTADNYTAYELQSHTGTIMECSACHAPGALDLAKDGGPHGMHNVNDERFWGHKHEDYYDQNKSACKACHGTNLKGSPLGKVADDRNFKDEDNRPTFIPKGTEISYGDYSFVLYSKA